MSNDVVRLTPRDRVLLAQQDLLSLIGKTLDAGINFFNTADVYTEGQSEEILGQALGTRRKDVVISTKAGFRTGSALLHQGLSRQHRSKRCSWPEKLD